MAREVKKYLLMKIRREEDSNFNVVLFFWCGNKQKKTKNGKNW